MQNLQKKHALLESDVSSRQDRVDGIVGAADQFMERGHFDADNIKAKQVVVLENRGPWHEAFLLYNGRLSETPPGEKPAIPSDRTLCPAPTPEPEPEQS